MNEKEMIEKTINMFDILLAQRKLQASRGNRGDKLIRIEEYNAMDDEEKCMIKLKGIQVIELSAMEKILLGLAKNEHTIGKE
jgi:hypothetical protein